MTISIELNTQSEEILNRLKGDMTPSAFFQLLLQMVDSQSVSAPIPIEKEKPDDANGETGSPS